MKTLPQHIVEGTLFEVDVQAGMLREVENRSNQIPFSYMYFAGTHYTFSYDKVRKNFPDLQSNYKDVTEIIMPMMTQLDPESMGIRFGKTPDEIKLLTDFELLVDPDLYKQRLEGILPTIDVAGVSFTVDVRLGELRMSLRPYVRVALDEQDLDDDGSYLFVYNPVTQEVVDMNADVISISKELLLIAAPDETILDPVGVAQKYAVSIPNFLMNHPIQKELKAMTAPLLQTAYGKRFQIQPQQQKKQPKPSQRLRKHL